MFAAIYPEAADGHVTFAMIGAVLAEFQMSNSFANAPLDRFARGERQVMSAQQKRGAILFFEKAKCVACHTVAGESNEMFTDFDNHVAGIPQIAPKGFGLNHEAIPSTLMIFLGIFSSRGHSRTKTLALKS